MFRLLLVVSVLLLGSLIAQTPNSQLPAPTAMELTDTHVIAEHTDNGHLSCDFSCLGCSHSVHDMCPDTLLTRSTSRHHQRWPQFFEQQYPFYKWMPARGLSCHG